jgi:hypothetical protein
MREWFGVVGGSRTEAGDRRTVVELPGGPIGPSARYFAKTGLLEFIDMSSLSATEAQD